MIYYFCLLHPELGLNSITKYTFNTTSEVETKYTLSTKCEDEKSNKMGDRQTTSCDTALNSHSFRENDSVYIAGVDKWNKP